MTPIIREQLLHSIGEKGIKKALSNEAIKTAVQKYGPSLHRFHESMRSKAVRQICCAVVKSTPYVVLGIPGARPALKARGAFLKAAAVAFGCVLYHIAVCIVLLFVCWIKQSYMEALKRHWMDCLYGMAVLLTGIIGTASPEKALKILSKSVLKKDLEELKNEIAGVLSALSKEMFNEKTLELILENSVARDFVLKVIQFDEIFKNQPEAEAETNMGLAIKNTAASYLNMGAELLIAKGVELLIKLKKQKAHAPENLDEELRKLAMNHFIPLKQAVTAYSNAVSSIAISSLSDLTCEEKELLKSEIAEAGGKLNSSLDEAVEAVMNESFRIFHKAEDLTMYSEKEMAEKVRDIVLKHKDKVEKEVLSRVEEIVPILSKLIFSNEKEALKEGVHCVEKLFSNLADSASGCITKVKKRKEILGSKSLFELMQSLNNLPSLFLGNSSLLSRTASA